MSLSLAHLADLVAIAVLVGALFLPRHGRRELVVAYLVVNVGVMAVATALASSTVGAGLGLGIFGVLSIIRLRSEELSQPEVAYYFAALALGLLGGLGSESWLTPALMAAVLVVLWIGDHPRLTHRARRQELVLDQAFTDEDTLRHHLTQLLGAEPTRVDIRKTDLVNDTTVATVSYRTSATAVSRPATVGGDR
ncbi:uncharacterized protein DUF4956 [Mumia flava]|uniref:Uncharacterized protein DUF4956 n=1 Tax=Mumia flava TaxID=1348852 RepID=A0A0B2B9E2_9ACTN|nr:DUF4956 domain-containing protein [Mumia flava]PJJ53460.1 uncharacterized protein DUF4956 [Mumia flava]